MDFEKELSKKVGDRLKNNSKKITQKILSESFDIAKGRISEIVNGKSKGLSFLQLYKLRIDFDFDLNELITGEPKNIEMTQINSGGEGSKNVQIISQTSEIEALKKTIKTQEKLIAMYEKQLGIE